MDATRPESSNPPPVERAEEMWDGLGRGLGRLAGRAGRGARNAAAAARDAANQLDRPRPSGATGAGATGAATERAEQMVDQWGARVGEWLGWAGLQIRKAAAYAGEEAEDILAEAEQIRHGNQNRPG